MSSGSNRLPSLSSGSSSSSAGKPALKFKPKAVARRSKEERDASAPQLKFEDDSNNNNKKKNKQSKRSDDNQQKKMPKYLNNTHVISSGPLAAGNFVADKSSNVRSNFIKIESSEVPKNISMKLQSISRNEYQESDDELESKGFDEINISKTENKEQNHIARFNMGKEFNTNDSFKPVVEEDIDMSDDLDANRIEELFPVRPVRIKHEEINEVQRNIQEAFIEQPASDNINNTQPIDTLDEKVRQLNLQQQFQSLDAKESANEASLQIEDYKYILQQIKKINNDPEKFMLFQLPSKLPDFQKEEQSSNKSDEKEESDKENKETKEKKLTTDEKENQIPTGNIGSVRVHESGRLSLKIGNVVMDVGQGSETTFFQDLLSLDEEAEIPNVKFLGGIESRVVVIPKL